MNFALSPLTSEAELAPVGNVRRAASSREDARGLLHREFGQRVFYIYPKGVRKLSRWVYVRIWRLVKTDEEVQWHVAVTRGEAIQVLVDSLSAHRSKGGLSRSDARNGGERAPHPPFFSVCVVVFYVHLR